MDLTRIAKTNHTVFSQSCLTPTRCSNDAQPLPQPNITTSQLSTITAIPPSPFNFPSLLQSHFDLEMSLLLLQHRAFAQINTNRPNLIPTILGVLTTLTASILTIYLTTHYISTITIPSDTPHWAQVAREQAYGVCYDGCNDCLDVSIIADACRLTAKVEIDGVLCDASKMWTWGDYEAKFPSECLGAVGGLYREDALRRKRFWWKGLYALTLLAFPLGYGVFLGVQWVIGKIQARGGNEWEGFTRPRPQVRTGNRNPRSVDTRTPLLAAAILTLVMVPQVSAYACIKSPAYNQLFADPTHSLFGVVHGWLSDCRDVSYSCGETCTQGRNCDTHWCSEEQVERTPQQYVNAVIPFVQKCGLRLVEYVPGIIDKRVANPNIEGKKWVKISVNRINNTEGTALDKYVRCLWAIPEPPMWFDQFPPFLDD